MPLKIESEYDIALEVNREPLYDHKRMNDYAKEKEIPVEELSDEEKEQFIVGYMSL